MSAPLRLRVAGIGAWLPGAPDWASLRGVLLGERALAADVPAKPAAEIVPAAERRRAPDGVRLAAEVAAQACAAAGVEGSTLPCVFASSYGELAITDYVCATLASAPLELSPTKFHNSVLNAPAGYWTIATACTAASSAVSAHHHTFAAGLFEAAVFACAEDTPVLFACGDVAASGPLTTMIGTRLACGVALVLVPATAGDNGPVLELLPNSDAPRSGERECVALQAAARDNPANADALALLAALASAQPARLALALTPNLSLDIGITP